MSNKGYGSGISHHTNRRIKHKEIVKYEISKKYFMRYKAKYGYKFKPRHRQTMFKFTKEILTD